VTFVRPLLRVHRTTILQWLSEKGVQFVEDPSNDDVSFTRNAIRACVLPALHRVFPQFRETFARSAGHAAQAQTLLDEIGAQDLQAACVGPQEGPSISQLQTLSDARLTNVLRWWLKSQFTVIPSQAQLAELMRLTRACKTRGHDIHLKVGQGFVRREGRALGWYNPRVLRKEN
jgi:tRNA(Ile)-lysidine synthase